MFRVNWSNLITFPQTAKKSIAIAVMTHKSPNGDENFSDYLGQVLWPKTALNRTFGQQKNRELGSSAILLSLVIGKLALIYL